MVHAAVRNSDIVTSWSLVENVESTYEYEVSKTSNTGTLEVKNSTELYHTFTDVAFGIYTICVKAEKVPEGIKSEEVCSDIISISSDTSGTLCDLLVGVPKLSRDWDSIILDEILLSVQKHFSAKLIFIHR